MLDPSLIPLVQRLDRDPEDREALETLCRELDGRGEHEVLAMLLEKVAGRRRTPEGSVELLHRAAEMWATKVGNDPRALPLWNQVLDAQPEHEGALLGLAAIFRRTNRAEQAEGLYRRLLEKLASPAKKVPVLEALAALYGERELPDREVEARRALAAARGPGAAATSNRRSLARLLVERSRRRAAATPPAEGEVDPDKREAAALLGAVAREGATGRATEFAQAALSLYPGDEGAFDVLEESGALKQSELTTLRIQFLAANPRGARGARVRRDLAEAYLATQRPEDAVTVLAAAVDDDPQAAQSLAKLYARMQRHLDLAKLLDRFPTPTESDARVALLRRRAAAWKAAGQKMQHLAALRALLDEVPAEVEALAEVERDCRLQGLLGELRDRLRAAATDEGADGASRVRWLREVAQLAERRFDDHADARVAWEALERVTDKAEERAEAQEALVRLMARNEDWDHVLQRLAAQAEAEEDASEARRRWMRWVQVRREHRPDAAKEVAVLERLRAQHPDDDAVARALVDARRRAGDDLGVTEVLYALIEHAGPANAASRWCQLAEHLERVGDLESSAEAWQSARTIDPTSALAWEAEARVLGALGDREAQLTGLVAYADHPVAAGRRAGELYARAAHLAFELGRKERAAQLAERALRFSPDDDAMKSLVATLEDPGTAPVPFEELLAEASRQETATAGAAKQEDAGAEEEGASTDAPPAEEAPVKEPEHDDAAEEPTGMVLIEHEVAAEEPTGMVLIEEVLAAAAAPPTPVEKTPVSTEPIEELAAELSEDLLEEIVPEAVEPSELPAPEAPAPVAADPGDHTPLQGVRLPESIAITAELAAPSPPPEPAEAPEVPVEVGSVTAEIAVPSLPPQVAAPQVAAPPPEAPSVTAELDALPVAPGLPGVAREPAPPLLAVPAVASAEDSMIIDESLFGDPPVVAPPPTAAPPRAPSIPPPVLTAPPSIPPPPIAAPPPISLPPLPGPSGSAPRPRIATAIPPSMPLSAPPPGIAAPSFIPASVSAPPAQPAPLAPPLQFNPQPVAAAAPPPALQFNPQPIVEAVAPPPALQFNPQPIAESVVPPPALQFNPQPAAPLASGSSPGDPFGRSADAWVVDASGDPFAMVPTALPSALPTPVAVEAPAPPEPAPPMGPAPAHAPAFERVLLPMFEALIGAR